MFEGNKSELNKDIVLTFNGKKDNVLKIFYDNGYLCWLLDNYLTDQTLTITKKSPLYPYISELFANIKNVDSFYNVITEKNAKRFEWISDGESVMGMQNRLTIWYFDAIDNYVIHFRKNKRDVLDNSCLIRFSPQRSNNKKIAYVFCKMYESILEDSFLSQYKKMQRMR